MYSRSYYPDTPERINIPENYDGTAFSEKAKEIPDNLNEVSFEEDAQVGIFDTRPEKRDGGCHSKPHENNTFLGGLFGGGGLFSSLNLRLPSIGSEEILILATAAFLLFSKGGDKECAILLLLLLMIN